MKKLTVLGSINADHVISVPYFPKAGETLIGSNYYIAYGGKGANQAVAAARLGANVDFIGCIGDDQIGQAMKQDFAKAGINVDNIIHIPQQMTGIAMIQVAATGENSIAIAAGANAHLDQGIVNQCASQIEQADYLLMQLETPLIAVIEAAKIAKAAQTHIILNPAPAQNLPQELLSLVDIITPNETETEILTGVKIQNEQDAQRACQILHQKGIDTVLITLGAKGIYLSQQGQQQGQLISGFKVQAKDTTAAGDTFNGGLACALCAEQTLMEAINFAQAAAAISVTRMGAQPSIPTHTEVLDFLAQQ